MAATGFNKTKCKKYVKTLGSELTTLKTQLKERKALILSIEQGDGKTAYWSGTKAKANVVNLKKNYNSYVKYYNALVDVYNTCKTRTSKKIKFDEL